MPSKSNYLNKGLDFTKQSEIHETIRANGVKIDSHNTAQTATNTKLDNLSGAPNNNLGMGASKLQVFPYGHDTVNDVMKPLKLDASGRLECSVDALEVTAETINLSTNDLETKVDAVTSKLDGFAGAAGNNLGTGASKLQTFPYGKDSANDIMRPIKVDAIGKVIVDSPAGSDLCLRLDAIQTAVQVIDNAISGNEMQCDIVSGAVTVSGVSTESKQDALIAANHTDLVALESSLTSIEGKIDTLDAVQDNALTKLGEIETSANALISANHTDLVALESSLTSIEGKIDTLDAVLDASLVKHGNNETLLTAGNVDHAANEVLLTAIAADGDAIQTKLDTIDGSINTLEGCVGSNKVNVNISSGGFDGSISGTVTANLSATDNAVLDAILAKNTEIETSANALISANHTDLVALESSLTSIEGKIDTLDAVLDASLVKHTNNETLLTAANVDHAANEVLLTNAEAHLGNIETSVQAIDDIALAEDAAHSSGQKGVMLLGVRQSSQADFAADGDYTPLSIDDDGKLRVAASAASGGSTEAKQDDVIGHINGVEGKLDHLSDNLDTLETTLSAIETDQAAIEVLLTAANTDHAANEVLLTAIDADTSNIATSTSACATDLAAIEVLLTAANVDHDANETLLTQCSQKLGDIETAVQLIDNGYGAMTETQLHDASVAGSGNVVSSVFTKTREITQFAISIVAATNGNYNAFLEGSVDNSEATYFQLNGGQSLNTAGNASSFAQVGSADTQSALHSSAFKYYRVRIINNHGSGQGFVVKVCF